MLYWWQEYRLGLELWTAVPMRNHLYQYWVLELFMIINFTRCLPSRPGWTHLVWLGHPDQSRALYRAPARFCYLDRPDPHTPSTMILLSARCSSCQLRRILAEGTFVEEPRAGRLSMLRTLYKHSVTMYIYSLGFVFNQLMKAVLHACALLALGKNLLNHLLQLLDRDRPFVFFVAFHKCVDRFQFVSQTQVVASY